MFATLRPGYQTGEHDAYHCACECQLNDDRGDRGIQLRKLAGNPKQAVKICIILPEG
jgi:hypothetical protein